MRPDDVLDLGRDLGTADRKRPVVGFDVADDGVGTTLFAPPGLPQHGVGLPHPGRRTQEDLELAASFLRRRLEQRVGRRALANLIAVGGGHGGL